MGKIRKRSEAESESDKDNNKSKKNKYEQPNLSNASASEEDFHVKKAKLESDTPENCDSSNNGGNEEEQPGTSHSAETLHKTGDTNDVDQNAACPEVEAVFAIDHIMESVFSMLHNDQKSLFRCRFLSKRWKYFASKQLQKTTELMFQQKPVRKKPNSATPTHGNIFKATKGPYGFGINLDGGRRFEHLLNLLDTGNSSVDFPCSSFIFIYTDLSHPAVQSFLTNHGPLLKKFVMDDSPYKPRHPIEAEDFKRLLLVQAPNLEYIELNCNVLAVVPGAEGNSKSKPNKKRDSAISLFDGNDGSSEQNRNRQLNNLKVLKIHRAVPENLLKDILAASPRLTEVSIGKRELLGLLVVEPFSRLHLLRTFECYLNTRNINMYEILANHIVTDGSWRLETLAFNCSNLLNNKPHLLPRVVDIVNKILKGCSQFVTKIVWEQNQFLEGLQFPVMPKLRELLFTIKFYKEENATYFLPESVAMEDVFPDLRHVELKCDDLNLPIHRVFSNQESVYRVDNVLLFGWSRFRRGEFQEMFPNARVHQFLESPGSSF